MGIFGALVALYLLLRLMSSSAEIVRLLHLSEPATAPAAPAEPHTSNEPVLTVVPDASARAFPPMPAADASLREDEGTAEANADQAGLDAGVPTAPTVAAPAPNMRPEAATSEPTPPERCGWTICPEGEVCCNWQCGTCRRPGELCDMLCGAPSVPISVPCGPNTCNVSQICCNRSCGTCVSVGETCSQEPCESIYQPISRSCGMNTCNVGQVCCNPSCGICAAPGETCSLAPCP